MGVCLFLLKTFITTVKMFSVANLKIAKNAVLYSFFLLHFLSSSSSPFFRQPSAVMEHYGQRH